MKIACCIVLAAFLALVSAECDLPFHWGDKCDPEFCTALNATFDTCRGKGPEKNEDETEVDWHKLSDEEKKARHAKCDEMQQCVEDKLKNSEDDKVKGQYNDIKTFCDAISSEGNNQDPNKPNKNHDSCLKFSAITGCDLNFGHGGKHGKGGRNGHKVAEPTFVAIDKHFMSMFK